MEALIIEGITKLAILAGLFIAALAVAYVGGFIYNYCRIVFKRFSESVQKYIGAALILTALVSALAFIMVNPIVTIALVLVAGFLLKVINYRFTG